MTQKTPVSPDATPVIIAGAPRSGTTFLTTALNTHPQVMVTNELRAWILFNDVRRKTHKPSEALPDHPLRARFRKAMLAQFATLFVDFYTQEVTKADLGCPAGNGASVEPVIKAYGDKNPSYADSNSKGCMEFIARALERAKFIHIHRDPRSCAASYKHVPIYADKVERWTHIWLRHTQTMIDLRDALGADRVLQFAYEDFVTAKGDDIFRKIEAHIGVDAAAEPLAFLKRERSTPTPYRAPSTPRDKLGRNTYADRLTKAELDAVNEACGSTMKALGY